MSAYFPHFCGILQNSVLADNSETNTAYLVGYSSHRKLIAIRGKFATVSHGIWQTGLQNLEKLLQKTVFPSDSLCLPIAFHFSFRNSFVFTSFLSFLSFQVLTSLTSQFFILAVSQFSNHVLCFSSFL